MTLVPGIIYLPKVLHHLHFKQLKITFKMKPFVTLHIGQCHVVSLVQILGTHFWA